MRRRLLQLLLLVLLGYTLVVLLLWSQQDRMVFAGAGRPARPIDAVGVECFELVGHGGLRFRAVQRIPNEPKAVLAFFVGNGEDLSSAARRCAELAEHGVAVVSGEYPGYGLSPGTPGLESIFAMARSSAAHAEALARARRVPFLVGGSSLGTFAAIHVAAAGGAVRCLLCAPPTSLVQAAAQRFWWLPVALLLRHRFDNEAAAARVRCPVLIVHGDQDDIVPLAMGERLRAQWSGAAELLVVAGAGHNDLPLLHGPVGQRVGSFLRGP